MASTPLLRLLVGLTVLDIGSIENCEPGDRSEPVIGGTTGTLEAGPLRVHPTNPRYFTDAGGKAIYLTGSHNDPNLLDMGMTDPPPVFDFDAYLAWLQRHNHNFIRLWRWTEAPKFQFGPKDQYYYVEPHPWMRTGSGTAHDGKLQFDLSQFNQAYFDRVRHRAIESGRRGIYVSIMLFEGGAAIYAEDFWTYHPFHRDNNINEIEADHNGDGKGLEFYTLQDSRITTLQKAYVRKMIETVNDLDNILYEICNECHEHSTDWQYEMIRFIKGYEAGQPKQHPVGMTTQHGASLVDNTNLLNSPADWISPGSTDDADFASDPPVLESGKVSILDSDHITPGGSYVDIQWVWKSFMRGHNPIFLDIIDRSHPRPALEAHPRPDRVRENMGYALTYANKVDLATMYPHSELCSSRYCLANPGREYLIYVPWPAEDKEPTAARITIAGEVSVDLSRTSAPVAVEWLNTASGEITSAEITTGGSRQIFQSPFHADSVLHLETLP